MSSQTTAPAATSADRSVATTAANQSLKMALGKLIFHDQSLSEPAGQSCHSCHRADAGFSDPDNMVSPGANPGLFGDRNAPSIAYAKFNPGLHWDKTESHWVGGFFHDGRAKTLQEQAAGPFMNPVEMGNASPRVLLAKIERSLYVEQLRQLYGKDVFADPQRALNAVTDAIVQYEQGPEFGLFNSKYDAYLKGLVALTPLEKQGLDLYEAEDKGNCAACHPSQPGPNGEPPLFTDYTYDNLGLAKNIDLPFLMMASQFNPAGKNYVDKGLAANPYIHDKQSQIGKFKVPTLRNINKTAPYMHDGSFNDLADVVEFYNSRDVDKKWLKAEIPDTVNKDELGDLKLTDDEMKAILAFLKTLDDGFSL